MCFCINPRIFGRGAVIVLALLLFLPLAARAEGIEVKSAELEPAEDAFVLNAELEVSLSPALEDALNKGVPLNFIADFELKKPRWYWLDETIAVAQRHLRLSYNALTRQYQLNVNGQYQNFSSLADARRELGRLHEWHVVEKSLLAEKPSVASKALLVDKALVVDKAPAADKAPAVDKVLVADKASAKKRTAYVAGLRMKLDLARLPKPLQVNALASKEWNLDSEWHRWNITP
ncbi:MAG TPA: DUF4390 domain-containing protein [Sulfuricella sp.]|nr:DUF4390 domain-containing protein [Sulfuricella sp.]